MLMTLSNRKGVLKVSGIPTPADPSPPIDQRRLESRLTASSSQLFWRARFCCLFRRITLPSRSGADLP